MYALTTSLSLLSYLDRDSRCDSIVSRRSRRVWDSDMLQLLLDLVYFGYVVSVFRFMLLRVFLPFRFC